MYYKKIAKFLNAIFNSGVDLTIPTEIAKILSVQMDKDFSNTKGISERYSNSLVLRAIHEESPVNYTRYQLLQTMSNDNYHLIFFIGTLDKLYDAINESAAKKKSLTEMADLYDKMFTKSFVICYNLVEFCRSLSYEQRNMTIADNLADKAPLVFVAFFNLHLCRMLENVSKEDFFKLFPCTLNCMVDSTNMNRDTVYEILKKSGASTYDEMLDYLYGNSK